MKHRRAAKIDANQPDIVKVLRSINGVTVSLNKDDIFVGYRNKNYWFEIKEPETVSKKTGEILDSKIKDSQHKLLAEWTGHYQIVWDVEQILTAIGVISER